ncbi:MAG: hypothetical protein WA771_03000, partial [Chthoniobacterales bacterium]
MKISPQICFLLFVGFIGVAGRVEASGQPVEVGVKVFEMDPKSAGEWVESGDEPGLAGVLSEDQAATLLEELREGSGRVNGTFETVVNGGELATAGLGRRVSIPMRWSEPTAAGERALALEFKPRNVGLEIRVKPTISSGAVALEVGISDTRFDGFETTGSTWKPQFSESEVTGVAKMTPGEVSLFLLGRDEAEDDSLVTLALVSGEISRADDAEMVAASGQVEIEAKFVEVESSLLDDPRVKAE